VANISYEWGFIGSKKFRANWKVRTINKFKQRCGLVVEEKILLSNSHSS